MSRTDNSIAAGTLQIEPVAPNGHRANARRAAFPPPAGVARGARIPRRRGRFRWKGLAVRIDFQIGAFTSGPFTSFRAFSRAPDMSIAADDSSASGARLG